MLNKNKKFNNL